MFTSVFKKWTEPLRKRGGSDVTALPVFSKLASRHARVFLCSGRHLWLGSMVLRGASGCDAAEPVAWLEKRRCEITRGRKASCSLTTLGMLMESSGEERERERESERDEVGNEEVQRRSVSDSLRRPRPCGSACPARAGVTAGCPAPRLCRSLCWSVTWWPS